MAARVEKLEVREMLTVTASSSFGLNPTTHQVDVPAINPDPANPNDPANDFYIHNVTLSVTNDAGVGSSVVNGVTNVTLNSSSVSGSSSVIQLSGTVVGPVGGGTFLPHTLIVHIMVNGVDKTDITNATEVSYNSSTQRDTVSFSGSVSVPAGSGTYSVGLVLENTSTNQKSPTIPFFSAKIDTSKPTVASIPVVGNSSTAINSVPVTFSKPILATTFSTANVSLTANGSPVALSGISISPSSGTASSFTISGLAPFTNASANYVISISTKGIRDASNNVATTTTTNGSFTVTLPPLVVVQSAQFATIKSTVKVGKKTKTVSQQVVQVQLSGTVNGANNAGAFRLAAPKTVKVKGKKTTTYSTVIPIISATPTANGSGTLVTLAPKGKLNFSQLDQLTIVAPALTDSLGRPVVGNQADGTYVIII